MPPRCATSPERFVGWFQDELERYNEHRATEAAKKHQPRAGSRYAARFRNTAITACRWPASLRKRPASKWAALPRSCGSTTSGSTRMLIANNAARRAAGDSAAKIQMHSARCARPARLNQAPLTTPPAVPNCECITLLPKWRNGRRAGLKIQCPQGRVGSSPTFGISVVACT